jgi:hypothetical protein
MPSRIVAIVAVAAFIVVSSCWTYRTWAGGYVIHSLDDQSCTFKIRQIPLRMTGGGYAYRCEE